MNGWRGQVAIALALSALVLVASDARCEPPSADRVIVELAAECGCDPEVVGDWLHLERLADSAAWGWPVGGLAAQACHESRCTADALGDWRTDKRGRRVAKAVGWFQLWGWAEVQGADRRHHLSAAEVYLETIRKGLRSVRRYCGKVRQPWRVSWVRVNRGPWWRRADRAGEARCSGAPPGGLKVWRRW